MRLTDKVGIDYIYSNFVSLNEPHKSVANKLGQLEDIEEELGIGLDVLYELLVRGCYYKCDNEILYTFGDVNVSNKCICNPYNKEVLFKDYGKTWALTKEELE